MIGLFWLIEEQFSCIAIRQIWARRVFVAASHQTRLDTRSKARRPIKVGIKGRGRSGTNWDSNPACRCCSSAHLVQCEPDEASSFTNPNVGPGTYASLRLKLDAWSSAVQGGEGDKNAARPPEGSLVETRCLIKGPKSAIVPFPGPRSGPKSRTGPGALARRSYHPEAMFCLSIIRQYPKILVLDWVI